MSSLKREGDGNCFSSPTRGQCPRFPMILPFGKNTGIIPYPLLMHNRAAGLQGTLLHTSEIFPASTAQKSVGVTMKSVLGWCRGLRLPYFAILASGGDFSVYVFHCPFALAPLSHFGGKLLRNVASLIQTNFTAHYVHHKQANNAKRPAENAGSPRKKSLFRPSARARPPKPRKPLILLTIVGSVPEFPSPLSLNCAFAECTIKHPSICADGICTNS